MLTCSPAAHADDTMMSVTETYVIMISAFFIVGSSSWLIGIERSFILGRKTVKLKARRREGVSTHSLSRTRNDA